MATRAINHGLATGTDLLEQVDLLRLAASHKLAPERKSELGQFLTPLPVAQLMASMLATTAAEVSILDAGAGVGSLFSAVVAHLCQRTPRPIRISVTACEIDGELINYLHDTIELCGLECSRYGIEFSGKIVPGDFIQHAVAGLTGDMFAVQLRRSFNLIVLNPPYRKIQSNSVARSLLRRSGIETTNLYTGFASVCTRLLEPGGEMVAILPRSFCNGAYFAGFRRSFLQQMSLRRLHLFESRQDAFRDDAVLQENVILHAVKDEAAPLAITITTSADPGDEFYSGREVEYSRVVNPTDRQSFIHIVPDEIGQHVVDRLAVFRTSLAELGLNVSTGRVVDFRAADYLRPWPADNTVPLIYPTHLAAGSVAWPKEGSKKPNALVYVAETADLVVPNEPYVLVKRFSAKEERRRLVAVVYDPQRSTAKAVGFENHLNYFHENGHGLSMILAKGLAAYLNSTLVDAYFRQFSGHTQVNATDLRNMRYPTRSQLETLGSRLADLAADQDAIDLLLEELLQSMVGPADHNPLHTMRRLEEARKVLHELDLPAAQQNERSALVLLALLDLTPDKGWADAAQPLRGITQMMDWFAEHYGKRYAPNTRETVRRQTVHQFIEAGLLIPNPDRPDRPINSGKNVYMIEDNALQLLRTYGTSEWANRRTAYQAERVSLAQRYQQRRQMQRLPVTLPSGETLSLSASGQNPLIKAIIEEFAARFTPQGQILYVGDADTKFALYERQAMADLGVTLDEHGKMPDVIIYHSAKGWLVLVEAMTSHGPIEPKRRDELRLFAGCKAGLVYVTAFADRKKLQAELAKISWETEVWLAESPDHLIHFDGERFLGPDPGDQDNGM